MIAVCDACKKEYNIDARKVPATGGFFSCRACGGRVLLPPIDPVASTPPTPQLDTAAVPPARVPSVADDLPSPADTETDLPAPVAAEFAPISAYDSSLMDLPTPTEDLPAATSAVTAKTTPAFDPSVGLNDLPAADHSAVDAHALSDLPRAILEPPPPVPARPPSFADQAPASGNIVVEDIPEEDSAYELDAVPFVPIRPAPNSPRIGEAPAPRSDPPTIIDQTGPAEPPTPALSIERDTPRPLEDPVLSAINASLQAPALMEQLMETEPVATAPASEVITSTAAVAQTTQKQRSFLSKRIAIAALSIVGLAIVGTSVLFFLHRGPFAVRETKAPAIAQATTGGTKPSPAPTTNPAPVAVGDAATPQNSTADIPAQQKSLPVLTRATVNTLTYAELVVATEAMSKTLATSPDTDSEGLLLWALYRMAWLGDDDAHRALATQAPKPPQAQRLGAQATAAVAGLLLLDGRVPMARALAEKSLKTRFRNDANLALVAARTYARPGETAKALRHLETLDGSVQQNPEAHILRAALSVTKATDDPASEKLVVMLSQTRDPSLVLTVVTKLIANGYFDLADTLTTSWTIEDLQTIPKSRKDDFLRLLLRRRWRDGDFAAARAAAAKRLEAAPSSIDAVIELAWVQAEPSDAVKQLVDATSHTQDETARSRLIYERVRLLLATDTKAATAALKDFRGTSSWSKCAEGLVAEKAGEMQEARAAYVAAAAMPPPIVAPRAALLTLGSDKPPVLINKLTQLAKRTASPVAEYRLARAWMQSGNAGKAYDLFNGILWNDPTVAPALDLLVARIEALERSGQAEGARTLIVAMRKARPEDETPMRLALGIALRSGKADDVVKASRALLDQRPNDAGRRLDLAIALNDASQFLEAERLLNDLQKNLPNSKDPRLLRELGRSWIERDAVKARTLITDAITREPNAKTYAALGALEQRLGHTDEALVAYRKAQELDPTLMETRYAMVRIMMQKRAFVDAAAELRRLAAGDPTNAVAREMLGDTLHELSDAKAAAAAYQSAVDIGYETTALLMKLARLQLEQLGQLGPATKTLRRAIKLNPKLAEAHYYLGLALKDLGKSAEARAALRSYLALAPKGDFAQDAQRYIDDLERM